MQKGHSAVVEAMNMMKRRYQHPFAQAQMAVGEKRKLKEKHWKQLEELSRSPT